MPVVLRAKNRVSAFLAPFSHTHTSFFFVVFLEGRVNTHVSIPFLSGSLTRTSPKRCNAMPSNEPGHLAPAQSRPSAMCVAHRKSFYLSLSTRSKKSTYTPPNKRCTSNSSPLLGCRGLAQMVGHVLGGQILAHLGLRRVRRGQQHDAVLVMLRQERRDIAQTGPKSAGTLMIRIFCTIGGKSPAHASSTGFM